MTLPSRPPFGVTAGQSPAAAAAEIVAVFDAVAARPDKLQWVERETARAFDGAAGPAMGASRQAGRASSDASQASSSASQASSDASQAIARAVDADAPRGDRLPYHNRQHFCEVMLVACFLAKLHALRPCEAQRLLLAALIHDVGHDGRTTADFGIERQSLAYAAPFLRDAGVDADERGRLAALVLATESREGTRFALRVAAAHAAGALPDRSAPAPELEPLRHDASLARLAVLLCEADLLPSAGLTAAHGRALQRRLAEEWQRPLDDGDKRRFLDAVLADGVIGPFFRPNAVRWRARLGPPADGASPG